MQCFVGIRGAAAAAIFGGYDIIAARVWGSMMMMRTFPIEVIPR